jgi:hypothetical protein
MVAVFPPERWLFWAGIRRPAQAGDFGTAQIIANGGTGYVETASDGTLPQLAVKVKTECFSDFAHG